MRNQLYLLLVLTLINNIDGLDQDYIRLGQHEHDQIGQMEHPLSGIQIHKTVLALTKSASIRVAGPRLLGTKGEDAEWVTINLQNANPTNDDWVGVFSPANFNESICPPQTSEEKKYGAPFICTAPLKFKFANYSNEEYTKTGTTSLYFRLINQRGDFSFAFFSGGLQNPKLISISNHIAFANPKAPLYPRLALGKSWDIMTVTWTSGYNIDDAVPFVEWGWKGHEQRRSPAGTLTFHRNSMCGMRTSIR